MSNLDPLSPDAPIVALMSLSSNPMLATATEEEVRALVQRLRQLSTSPQALTAKLETESPKRERKPSKAAALKSKLDML